MTEAGVDQPEACRFDDLVPEPHELFDGTATKEAFVEIGENFVAHYLIGRCRLEPTHAVLDIGSGNGQKARPLTRYLSPQGRYAGFDIVKAGIDWCHQRYASWPNFQFDFQELRPDWYNPEGRSAAQEFVFPYGDESFDVVFMSSVATHMLPEELEHYLRESHRVMKRGGRFFATLFLMSDEALGASAHLRIQDREFQRIAANLWTIDPERPSRGVAYREAFARSLVARAGLRVAEITFGMWSGADVVGALQDTILAVKPIQAPEGSTGNPALGNTSRRQRSGCLQPRWWTWPRRWRRGTWQVDDPDHGAGG